MKPAHIPINAKVNIHSLSKDEQKKLMRKEFEGYHRFQSEFKTDSMEFECLEHSKALKSEILRILKMKGVIENIAQPLETIHERIPQEMKNYNYNDGVNKITTYLYDTDEQFINTYHKFIKECIRSYFKYPFYFQATTTIRIHCPGGENSNHYPRYHTDIGYGHPPQEINLWMPLTEPQGEQGHGFRIMSLADSRKILDGFDYDFEPFINKAINDKEYNYYCHQFAPQVKTRFGKFIAFDPRCVHTGEPLEKHTRASIDIRILPVEDYEKMNIEYQGTGRRRILYTPGEGYYNLSSDEL